MVKDFNEVDFTGNTPPSGVSGSIKEQNILEKQKMSTQQTRVELRRKKLEELMSKNRNIDINEEEEIDENKNPNGPNFNGNNNNNMLQSIDLASISSSDLALYLQNLTADTVDFYGLTKDLRSRNILDLFAIVQRIRKLLSTNKNTESAAECLEKLVNSPFLKSITEILAESHEISGDSNSNNNNNNNSSIEDLNYEISWILINVAAGTTLQAQAIVQCGAMAVLMDKIANHSISEKFKEHILWIFANVIGDGPDLRDRCLEMNILPLIYQLVFDPQLQSQTIKHYLAWIISNILRPTKQEVSEEVMEIILRMIEHLINLNPNDEVNFDIIWSLYYVQTSSERRGIVIKQGFHKYLIKQLYSSSEKNQKAASKALFTLTITDNSDMQLLLDENLIDHMAFIFENKSDIFKFDALITFCNVSLGYPHQKSMLVSHPIFPLILSRMPMYSERLQREIRFIVANLICSSEPQFIKSLLQNFDNLFLIFIKSLTLPTPDLNLVLRNLDAAHALLACQELLGKDVALIMEKEGALEAIENLQMHDNDDVYKKATNLIKNFFSNDDEILIDNNIGTENANDNNQAQNSQKFDF